MEYRAKAGLHKKAKHPTIKNQLYNNLDGFNPAHPINHLRFWYIYHNYMNHLPHLIKDLGLILVLAGITTLLFKWLKQPVVLGYLLAGLLVSPHFPFLPNISEIDNIRIWADIGVIFLLFTLGLEFSFKKLMKVGGSAAIIAFVEITAMLGIGFLLGYFMGWPIMDAIFLGGILSIASTTIIIRSFEELGVKGKKFVELVFGILIIEDLIAVVLMVVLSTISVSRQFQGVEMINSVLKLIFFLALWFISGIFFIPSILSKIQKHLNDETMLILSIGFCLFMVILASQAGFSPALGAFIMGSILAETTQAERIEHLIKPVKDLFGAVFFISVGMLINPHLLMQYAGPIAIITIIFVVAKIFHVTAGALLAGQPMKTSLYAGMSMGQIGEFSFIIATLGLTLNVTSDFLYPIAVAVSAITTFTTPYLIKLAQPLFQLLEKALPARWKKTLDRYSQGTQTISSTSDWQQVLKFTLGNTIFFAIIITGIVLLFSNYVEPIVYRLIAPGFAGTIVTAALCFISLSPFLWALAMRKLKQQAYMTLWNNKRYHAPLMLIRMIRGLIGIAYIGFFLLSFFSIKIALVGIVVMVSLSLAFLKRIHAFYSRLESRFFYNFNNRELHNAKINRNELAPWDAHISQFTLPQGSPLAGMTLEEIGLREKIGVNIAMLKRGEYYTLSAPSRHERIYPEDKLLVIGTDEQLENFKQFLEPKEGPREPQEERQEVVLKKIDVDEGSWLIGKSIRESGVREKTNGIVVGLERSGRRLLNPQSTVIFERDDKMWIVGDPKLIATLATAVQVDA